MSPQKMLCMRKGIPNESIQPNHPGLKIDNSKPGKQLTSSADNFAYFADVKIMVLDVCLWWYLSEISSRVYKWWYLQAFDHFPSLYTVCVEGPGKCALRTMIYDEAFEVNVDGLSFLAFSKFERLGLALGRPVVGESPPNPYIFHDWATRFTISILTHEAEA